MSSCSYMFTVTQRLDGEPGGLEDRAKVTQVRLRFSTPSRTTAPRIRLPCAVEAPSPVLNQGEEAESRLRKKVLENVSEVVRDLVVTDGNFPSCQLPAYRL